MESYQHPHSMEPLLPQAKAGHLAELTCEIQQASGVLTAQVNSPHFVRRVAQLAREMNCYYSNLIEGHKTIPRDIERAMRQEFSDDQNQRDNQQLSVAHIAVEKRMVERLASEDVEACSPEFITWHCG